MKIHIQYFAIFRQQRGLSQEDKEISKNTSAKTLYNDLAKKNGFKLSVDSIRVAINDHFTSINEILRDGDHIVFIPPVSGG